MLKDGELSVCDGLSVLSLGANKQPSTEDISKHVIRTTLGAIQRSTLAYDAEDDRDLGRYSGNLALGGISADPLHVEPWKLGVSYSFLYAHPLDDDGEPLKAVVVVVYLEDAKNPDVFDEFVRSSRRGKHSRKETVVNFVSHADQSTTENLCDAGAVGKWTKEELDELQYQDIEADFDETSPWRDTDATDCQEDQDLCGYPHEHFNSVLSPSTIIKINRARIEAYENMPGANVPPVLEFGGFVAHEGEAFVLRAGTPHALVSIGQTYTVSHNFLEPGDMRALYSEDGEGRRQCQCEDGVVPELGSEFTDLRLRGWTQLDDMINEEEGGEDDDNNAMEGQEGDNDGGA